jgi:hypothetical protein
MDFQPKHNENENALSVVNEYREKLKDSAEQLLELVAELRGDKIVNDGLIAQSRDALDQLLSKQKELCDVLAASLPESESRDLATIENALNELAKSVSAFEEAKLVLEKFQTIGSDRQDAADAITEYQSKAQELLDTLAPETARAVYPPYALFVDIVANPNKELSPDQENMIEQEFPHPIHRYLWRGQYYFIENSAGLETISNRETSFEIASAASIVGTTEPESSNEPEAEDSMKPEPKPEPNPESKLTLSPNDEGASSESPINKIYDNSKYKFTTATKKFAATSFIKDYAKKDNKGKWVFNPAYGVEAIECLYAIGSSYVLSHAQIADHIVSGEDVANSVLDKLSREALVTRIQDTSSGDALYCLSANGYKAFTQASSRELITSMRAAPPESYVLDDDLKSGKYSIEHIKTINSIAFFLDEKGPSFLEETTNVEVDSMLIRSFFNDVPCVMVSTKTKAGNHILSIISESPPLELEQRTSEQEGSPACFFINVLKIGDSPPRSNNAVGNKRVFSATWDYETDSLQLKDAAGLLINNPLETLYDVSNSNSTSPRKKEVAEFDKGISSASGAERECAGITKDEVRESDQFGETVADDEPSLPKSNDSETEKVGNTEKAGELDAGCYDDVVDPLMNGLNSDTAASQLASYLLDNGINPETSPELYEKLIEILLTKAGCGESGYLDDGRTQALILLKALSIMNGAAKLKDQYSRVLLALDSRLEDHLYNGESLLRLFNAENEGTVLHMATLLRTVFSPSTRYDFSLESYKDNILRNYDTVFPDFTAAKPLYSLFNRVLGVSPAGFSATVLRQLLKGQQRDAEIQAIRERALACVDEPNIQAKMRGMPKMLSNCFGSESDLGICMRMIANGTSTDRAFAHGVWDSFCKTDDNNRSVVSDDIIDNYIKDNWRIASAKERTRNVDLMGLAKKQLVNAVKGRLDIIDTWLIANIEGGKLEEPNLSQLDILRNEVIDEFDRLLSSLESLFMPKDIPVLRHALLHLSKIITKGTPDNYWEFAEFLQTNVFPISTDALPVIDDEFNEVPNYEPWRNALKHITTNSIDLKTALARISDKEYPTFRDNIGIAAAICRYLKLGKSESQKYKEDTQMALARQKTATEQFMAYLDQALAYGRISEDYREDMLLIRDSFEQYFIDTNSFGCYQAFLKALEKSIEQQSKQREVELLGDIEKRESKATADLQRDILNRARAKLYAPERNYVVTEELINRFDSGDTDEGFFEDPDDPGEFSKFIDKEYYEELRGLCAMNKSKPLYSFGSSFVERKLMNSGVSRQYQENAQHLLKSMPNRRDSITTSKIEDLLHGLGFRISNLRGGINRVSPKNRDKVSVYSVEVEPSPKDKAEYLHPVDIFGTKLRVPMHVVYLFGNLSPNDVIERVCGLELNSTALVIMDGFLDASGRRQLAELFHESKTGLNPFLFIDRILLIHLALHERSQRIPVMLSCTLPYTSSFQPFVMTGSVSDEMFIGRKEELRSILDPNGPAIVYGGRQLGKTALLERARSLATHPKNLQYAVYMSVFGYREEQKFVEDLVAKIQDQGLKVKASKSVKDLCTDIKSRYGREWKSLTLLIDEADSLLESFRRYPVPYEPVSRLLNLRRETNNDLKFVFAGLHNVCRAANDPNSVFGQLGAPLCIKPLSPPDSLQLLTKPLRYLGFVIEEGKLEHLLVNTNFYPGIIHYVGFSIVKNLTSRYRQFYKGTDSPPYGLTEKQLGSIISSESLNERIDERIKWTLEVDSRYFMLARCIAYLYYEYPDQARTGYPASQVHECAQLLDIGCLDGLTSRECETLLIELVGMGILVNVGESSYRLRQYRFLGVLGRDTDAIEQAIKQAEA